MFQHAALLRGAAALALCLSTGCIGPEIRGQGATAHPWRPGAPRTGELSADVVGSVDRHSAEEALLEVAGRLAPCEKPAVVFLSLQQPPPKKPEDTVMSRVGGRYCCPPPETESSSACTPGSW